MIVAVLSTLFYAAAVLLFLAGAFRSHLVEAFAIGLVLTGGFILFSVYQTFRFIRSATELETVPELTVSIGEIAAVAAGALSTTVLIRHFSFPPVAASALIGILGSFFVPAFPFSIFCGSFVGMTSPSLLNYPQLTAAALLSGIVFVTGRYGFHGMGGKLGVTAFVGVVAAVVLFSVSAPTGPQMIMSLDGLEVLLVIALSGLGSFLTYLLNQRWKIHIVASSGIVGLLIVGLLIISGTEDISLLSGAVYCASFAGMCNRNRLRGPGLFILVGMLSGLLFLLASPVFHQFGGKLGTIAFISALGVKTLGEWIQPSAHEFFCED